MLECMQDRTAFSVVRVTVPRIDAAVASGLKESLVEMIDQGATRLVIDFSDVGFIDSSGLGAVVGVLKHMGRRGTVEVACLSPTVMKVFRLTRMTKVFTIHDSVPHG